MIEEFPLYDGEITLVFDGRPRRHQYYVLNRGRKYKVPSVTKITGIIDKSGPLVGWATNCVLDVIRASISPGVEYSETYLEEVFKAAKGRTRNVKDEAAGIGKQVHEWIETYTKGEEPILPPEGTSVRSGVDAFLQWLSEHSVEFIERERACYSRKHRYSGRLDAIARVDGTLTLLDYKTSNGIYPEYFLQAAAYGLAYTEETGTKLDAACILKLNKDNGEFSTFALDARDLRRGRGAFLAALGMWRAIERFKKRL